MSIHIEKFRRLQIFLNKKILNKINMKTIIKYMLSGLKQQRHVKLTLKEKWRIALRSPAYIMCMTLLIVLIILEFV